MKLKQGLLSLIFIISLPVYASPQMMDEKNTATVEQDATTATSTENMQEASGLSTGTVFRAAFTSNVENREPTDDLEKVSGDQNQLFFFTELRDMSGQTARHRWEHAGKVMAEVEFNVKGPRWRVWSSKSFVPGWAGDWKVSVINAAGDVIKEKNFTYETAVAEQADPATENEAATMPEMHKQ